MSEREQAREIMREVFTKVLNRKRLGFHEIGLLLCVSKQDAHQIHDVALRKLKRRLAAMNVDHAYAVH